MTAEELLEQLAAIWVKRWVAHGGGLIALPDGDGLQISMDLRFRPEAGPDAPGWQRLQRISHGLWNVGRWRELSEICEEAPGLREAIVHHVALHGTRYAGGGRAMWAPASRDCGELNTIPSPH